MIAMMTIATIHSTCISNEECILDTLLTPHRFTHDSMLIRKSAAFNHGATMTRGPTIAGTIRLAQALGYTAAQIFFSTKKQEYTCPSIDETDLKESIAICNQEQFHLYVHTPYSINLTRLNSINSLLSYTTTAESLAPCVVHIGTKGTLMDVATSLGEACHHLRMWGRRPLLLETSAGAGTQLGRDYDEIRTIFEAIDTSSRIGLCLDTQHWFSAGQCQFESVESVVECMETLNSISRVSLIHLNDSAVSFGAKVDSHACLTEGQIWREDQVGLYALVSYCNETGIDMVTETNNGPRDCRLIWNIRTALSSQC